MEGGGGYCPSNLHCLNLLAHGLRSGRSLPPEFIQVGGALAGRRRNLGSQDLRSVIDRLARLGAAVGVMDGPGRSRGGGNSQRMTVACKGHNKVGRGIMADSLRAEHSPNGLC